MAPGGKYPLMEIDVSGLFSSPDPATATAQRIHHGGLHLDSINADFFKTLHDKPQVKICQFLCFQLNNSVLYFTHARLHVLEQ